MRPIRVSSCVFVDRDFPGTKQTIHEITRTNTKKELILVSFGTHEIADQAMQIEGVFWTDQAKSV